MSLSINLINLRRILWHWKVVGVKPIQFQIGLSRASFCVIRWNEKELVHWLELD
jgi:hypothetical protein